METYIEKRILQSAYLSCPFCRKSASKANFLLRMHFILLRFSLPFAAILMTLPKGLLVFVENKSEQLKLWEICVQIPGTLPQPVSVHRSYIRPCHC